MCSDQAWGDGSWVSTIFGLGMSSVFRIAVKPFQLSLFLRLQANDSKFYVWQLTAPPIDSRGKTWLK